ncbi:hypothetical protein WJ47_11970 [Burkholderia ubonensis]|uniref:Twin-arginine translocation pathway signal protein n=1 Tax=Burkholderia ubonensis TaxID=101571 RepID=A0AB73G8W7_9BURK|nr:hypothetical protein [Burkholderia ubonensis]KVK80991.1 hypothetical protein WJ44_09700 [Burkholderia ubonensis]KVL66666.1 hypothetical protein WJ47_11970 [Burkholderia ubonensis]KVM36459.1 hypothetical protein WJ54_33735 [Burkholderia ubonensis]KVM41039.1 hypothetical protein WJ53_00305 [Burkholderia ubonensis]KVN91149.1 hypothetical protein WJ69_11745 [Burkholderia ubonensis]
MSGRRWTLALAITATATALSLSVLAGWQRGGTLAERFIWIAIGTVLVTSAHLLPALIREMPIAIRSVGSLLWSACLVTACYGHAVFFALAQQHAGELRASTVQATPATSPARSLTVVMAERAAVTAQLTAANARHCVRNCVTLASRRATLTAKLDALNAEADDVRRQQAAADRVTTQRDALLVDPVTARLAALLDTTTGRVDLLTGLAFAAVLEGVACLLWSVALRSPLPVVTGDAAPAVTVTRTVTEPVVAAVTDATDMTPAAVMPVTASHVDETVSRNSATPSHDRTTGSHAPRDDPIAPLPAAAPIDDHLSRLVRDVAAGLVRPTVADIRRHLSCSQARAAELRRQLADYDVTA